MAKGEAGTDLVRRHREIVEAASRRDFDRVMDLFAPDAVWDTASVVGVIEGSAAIRALLEDWFGTLVGIEVEAEDVQAFGGDVTLLVVADRANPRGGEGVVERSFPVVATWRGGLVSRATNYVDLAEARAAAEQLASSRGPRRRPTA